MSDESYADFEKRFEAIQEQQKKQRLEELDKKFPIQERVLHLQQIHTEKEQEKLKLELEQIEEEPLIDVTQFKPLSAGELLETLGLTIKRDEINKLITFLAQLSAYTEDSQLNISFNAPSASGKSYIPTEIARLFPSKDVIEVAYCSPTAFFHDYGEFDKEKGGYIVNLSRKIIIFLDQPHTLLLQHLRPLLSHDNKIIRLKVTDKSQKKGLQTKNIFLIGYPTVIFCTAGLNLDEQEATRFLLLSPEINQEKIREAIFEKIRKESDSANYSYELESDPGRISLKDRILAIKQENIKEIKIGNPELVKKLFIKKIKTFKPRNQRDIGRILSLVKVFALFNLWFRERNGSLIKANDEDITEAFKVWDAISESQELNLPPFVYNLYKDVVIAAYKDRNGETEGAVKIGLSRPDLMQKHYQVYGRFLPDWMWRQQIIPQLETAGLITQEPDPTDKRRILVYPTPLLTIPRAQNYSESSGGVDSDAEKSWIESVKQTFGITDELEDIAQKPFSNASNE